jgi:hypothetical protein
MIEAEPDDIREAFEEFFLKKYLCTQCAFARNENRSFDSAVETAWQAFQAGFKFAKGEKMSEQKIEEFWRDATAEDVAKVMRGEKVEARFRDYDHADWTEFDLLGGFATSINYPVSWFDVGGVRWFLCQVYDPPQWYTDKPDPGEGYRLLEKFPAEDLQPGDEWFEPAPFETGWKVSHNERQATFLWYRRRIEPNSPEKLDSCVDHLKVGKEYKLPSGQSIFVTEKGFEVL